MSWTQIDDFQFPGGWSSGVDATARARDYCQQLERGGILFFSAPPFDLPQADREFVLSQKQSTFKGHKNIAYKPLSDALTGDAGESPEDTQRLRAVMRRYSKSVTQFVDNFLLPYAGKWKVDYASFRPVEEKNRANALVKRNDLAHVDAFPTRPTFGGRILRVFTNLNPQRNRIWEVTDPFPVIAQKFADRAGLPKIARSAHSRTRAILRGLAPVLRSVGVKGLERSPYDSFMLNFHDWLKKSDDYQQRYPKTRIEFPPMATWLVYTDTVPHAVLEGQYAVEQTFIVPVDAMVNEECAPIRVLESMCGTSLAN